MMEKNHNETTVCIQANEITNKKETQSIIEFDKIEHILDFNNDNAHPLPERTDDNKSHPPKRNKIITKEPIKLLELRRNIGKNQKRFLCSVCGKGFLLSAHLHRHMCIHTGEKPYFCHICRQRFSRSDRMSAHLQSHRSEKLHCCCVCKEIYSDLARFVDHCRMHDDSEYIKVARGKSIVQANLKSQLQVVEDSILISTFKEQLEFASCVTIEKEDTATDKDSILWLKIP